MSSYANWAPGFKERYGDWINPLPEEDTLAELGEFIKEEWRPGVAFNFPIKVQNEGGVTHNVDGSAFTVNDAIDSVWQNARLDGATVLLCGNLPYDVNAKSSNGAGPGSKGGAFWKATDQKVESMMVSASLYRELNLAYGAGTASTIAASIGAVAANVSGTTLTNGPTITITRATWAPGVWNQIRGHKVDIYQSDGATLRESGVTVTSAATSGTQNRLVLTKSGSAVTVAAGDLIVLNGQKAKSCYGLQAILENTGSLFNISASTYGMWQSCSFSAGSATLTRAKIGQFASRIFPNGLKNGGNLFVSGPTFADLGEEADALVQWTVQDGNAPKLKRQGTNRLEFASQIGPITIVNYIYQKQSLAFFVGNSESGGSLFKRVGASDITFALPGTREWFWTELSAAAGSQLRCYSNQAGVLEIPYHCGEITAISNNGDTSPS